MTTLALISNPKSQQNRRGFSAIEAAASTAGYRHLVLADMADLLPALRDLADQETDLLAVNGGDGTLQAVLTALLEERPFERLPLLAVLPRGMTNMTACDVGLTGKPADKLTRLAELDRQQNLGPNIVRRHVLRLEQIPGEPVQRGMFFGAGGICRAIDYCRSKVHPFGIQADWAAGLTLAGLLASWLLRGGRSEVLVGDRVVADFDDGSETSGELLLALATTLDRLVMNSQPFWGQHGEPLRYTTVGYPPRRLLRSARRVLYGGNERRLPEDSYMSRGASSIRLRFSGRFTLDGQLFDAPEDRPLVITAPETVDFVRL